MMTKADKFLVRDIHNILDNGYKDINPRPVYESCIRGRHTCTHDQRKPCYAPV